MGVDLDKVVFSTLTDTYVNYSNTPGTITIPAANMPDGTTNSYSTTIPYTRANTRADVYFTGNGLKVPANGGFRATNGTYTPTSSENVNTYIRYSATSITVVIEIQNFTGGPITLIAQSVGVNVVAYDAPLSSL